MAPVLVNLGCGDAWHPEWLNFDVRPSSAKVHPLDLRRSLPLRDRSVDAVYHSHVLEHLPQRDGLRLITECHRVLKPGGVLRVAVPDLEVIARNYLTALGCASSGDDSFTYDWSLIELFDQVVRNQSTGEMAAAIASAGPEQRRHVEQRIGELAQPASAFSRALTLLRESPDVFWAKVRSRTPSFRQVMTDIAVFAVGGRHELDNLRVGRFRTSGEAHLWMYDRFSLARLFRQAGFVDLRVAQAGQSRIPGFAEYGLETVNGREKRPDSLYAEGLRAS
jgi:SAM-dependent methyltransferase